MELYINKFNFENRVEYAIHFSYTEVAESYWYLSNKKSALKTNELTSLMKHIKLFIRCLKYYYKR